MVVDELIRCRPIPIVFEDVYRQHSHNVGEPVVDMSQHHLLVGITTDTHVYRATLKTQVNAMPQSCLFWNLLKLEIYSCLFSGAKKVGHVKNSGVQ